MSTWTVGQKVASPVYSYGPPYHFRSIARVTKTFVETDDGKKWTLRGMPWGESYFERYIKPHTPEHDAENFRHEREVEANMLRQPVTAAVQRCRDPDKLRAIAAILDVEIAPKLRTPDCGP